MKFHRIIFFFIFLLFVFLRFYDIESRMQFTWDQVQNAWVMKDMLIDHKFPLVGMVAKLNSGFYVGPAYYYLLAPFYSVTNLDPIAAGYFAGFVSTLTFIIFYFITKSLFNVPVSLVSIAIYTVSYRAIIKDRIAWPVVFIPLVSLLIFYFLYKSLVDSKKYFLYLAAGIGFSFHIHFTSIFYLIILLLASPLFLKRSIPLKYYIVGTGIFFIWLIPNIVAEFFQNQHSTGNLLQYLSTYYLGIHFRRISQIFSDSMIEVESTVHLLQFRFLKYVFLPFFLFTYLYHNISAKRATLAYLLLLWFFVPLGILSVYSGEISDYYFSLTRPFAIITIAYVLWYIWRNGNLLMRVTICIFGLFYTFTNIMTFLDDKYSVLPQTRMKAMQAVREHRDIGFTEGDPVSYLYYIYSQPNRKKP